MTARSASAYTRSELFGFRIQLVIAFLTTTAIAGSRPTTTYRALDLGAGTFEVGLVQSAFSFLPALTAVAVGRWIDRNGESRMYTMALIALAFGAIVSAVAGNLMILAAGQSLIGFGAIGGLIAGQAMIVTRAAPEDWNRRYGSYAAFLSLGQLVGPSAAAAIQATPTLQPDPERIVFVAAAVAALGAAALTRLIPPGTRPASSLSAEQGGFLPTIQRVLRRSGMPSAMFVSVSVASTIDILAAYLPVYGVRQNLSVQLVGLLLSVRAAATMASRLAMDRLIRRFGWQRVLVACLAISATTLALIPATAVPVILISVAVGLGLAIGLTQPMTITWVANRAPRAERGTALAVRLTGNRISLLFVPAVMGAIAGSAGVATVFWVVACVLGLGSVVAQRSHLSVADETVTVEEPTDAISAAAAPPEAGAPDAPDATTPGATAALPDTAAGSGTVTASSPGATSGAASSTGASPPPAGA